jgi:hypothetical protein
MNAVKAKAVFDSLTLGDVLKELSGKYDSVLCNEGGGRWFEVQIEPYDRHHVEIRYDGGFSTEGSKKRQGYTLPVETLVRVRGDEVSWVDALKHTWRLKFMVQSSLNLEPFFGLISK